MRQPNMLPIFGESDHAYQLAEDYLVSVEGFTVHVPCGLVVDGASVPRVLWWLYPPDGLYRAAALVHDYFYQLKGIRRNGLSALSRSNVDGIFKSIIKRTIGLDADDANVMWMAVRLFGWLPWKRSTGVPRIEPLRYQIS